MHSNRYFYRLLKNVHWSIGSALQSLLTPMMSWTEEPTGQTVHTWILSQKRSRLDLLQLLYQPFFSASLSPSVGSYSPPPLSLYLPFFPVFFLTPFRCLSFSVFNLLDVSRSLSVTVFVNYVFPGSGGLSASERVHTPADPAIIS